ncbi:hypothetical protein BGX33_007120 [Mortierella sp. NVP41]|nr:hypothetical protein BGX33_007120 [Mortierella sp. NVP41]
MTDNVYARISEKMKNERFTEDEIKTVEKAKGQLSSYTTGGSVIGGAAGLMLARAKSFKGLQAMAIATGGFLIGSQIGIIMGAMASVRTIQSIPNFQRVINIVQEVRDEGTKAAGGAGGGRGGGALQHDLSVGMPSAGHQRFPIQQREPRLGSELMSDDAVAQQAHPEPGFKDGDGYHGGRDPNSGSSTRHDSAWAHVDQRAKELHSNSKGWSQIRRDNMPRSAWNDVRDGRPRRSSADRDSNSDDDDDDDSSSDSKRPATTTTLSSSTSTTTRLSGWNRVRRGEAGADGSIAGAPDGPSEFPRTREDLESRPSRQKNQYGDAI